MRSCILHLGMPKTASTSIQTTLYKNRSILKEHNWEYPVLKCPEHENIFPHHNDPICRIFMPGNVFHVQRLVKNNIINLPQQQKVLREELDNICLHSNNIIISSEVLLSPRPLKAILEYFQEKGFTVKAILYVRSPFSYKLSIYQSLLKFSQSPKSVFIKNLEKPLVKNAIELCLNIFPDSLQLYPFNYLAKTNVDIVKHFLSHLIPESIFESIKITRDNASPSWQSTELMDYIEEKCPLYINNSLNKKRFFGDTRALYDLPGEKFRISSDLFKNLKPTIDLENEWLEKTIGKNFCDVDYSNQISDTPVIWNQNDLQGLNRIFSHFPANIQNLIKDYMNENAVFSKEINKIIYLSSLKKATKKKKLFRFFVYNSIVNTTKLKAASNKIKKFLTIIHYCILSKR